MDISSSSLINGMSAPPDQNVFLSPNRTTPQRQEFGGFLPSLMNTPDPSDLNGHDVNMSVSPSDTDTGETEKTQQQCTCKECGKVFNSVWYLKQHAVKHSNDRPFECKWCHKTYKFRSNLYQHKCPDRVKNQGNRGRGRARQTPFTPILSRDSPSTQSSSSASTVGLSPTFHTSMLNTPTYEPQLDDTLHTPKMDETPNDCMDPTQGMTQEQVQEFIKKWKSKLHQCRKCHLFFPTREYLSCHTTSHSITDSTHQCLHCSQTFDSERAYATHKRSHTPQSPNCCHKCNGQFISRLALRRHRSNSVCHGTRSPSSSTPSDPLAFIDLSPFDPSNMEGEPATNGCNGHNTDSGVGSAGSDMSGGPSPVGSVEMNNGHVTNMSANEQTTGNVQDFPTDTSPSSNYPSDHDQPMNADLVFPPTNMTTNERPMTMNDKSVAMETTVSFDQNNFASQGPQDGWVHTFGNNNWNNEDYDSGLGAAVTLSAPNLYHQQSSAVSRKLVPSVYEPPRLESPMAATLGPTESWIHVFRPYTPEEISRASTPSSFFGDGLATRMRTRNNFVAQDQRKSQHYYDLPESALDSEDARRSLTPGTEVIVDGDNEGGDVMNLVPLYAVPPVGPPPTAVEFNCNFCLKPYHSYVGLKYHMLKRHMTNKDADTIENLLACICVRCGFRMPNRLSLREHIQLEHQDDRPFICPDCNKGFRRDSNLRDHMLVHKNYRAHQCPKCGFRFTLKSNWHKHVRKCKGDPPSKGRVARSLSQMSEEWQNLIDFNGDNLDDWLDNNCPYADVMDEQQNALVPQINAPSSRPESAAMPDVNTTAENLAIVAEFLTDLDAPEKQNVSPELDQNHSNLKDDSTSQPTEPHEDENAVADDMEIEKILTEPPPKKAKMETGYRKVDVKEMGDQIPALLAFPNMKLSVVMNKVGQKPHQWPMEPPSSILICDSEAVYNLRKTEPLDENMSDVPSSSAEVQREDENDSNSSVILPKRATRSTVAKRTRTGKTENGETVKCCTKKPRKGEEPWRKALEVPRPGRDVPTPEPTEPDADGKWPCPRCPKKFRGRNWLRQHLAFHSRAENL